MKCRRLKWVSIVTLTIDAPISQSPAPKQAAREERPAVSSPSPRPAVWTPVRLGMAALFLAGGLFATRGAWEEIIRIGLRDKEASHIWLVPFLVVWLVWVHRKNFANVAPHSSLVGPVMVGAGWALTHWGFYSARHSPVHFGALLVLVGCLVTILGVRAHLKFWPALVVLAFMVPVPGMVRQKVSIPLEQVTAAATTSVLKVVGAPISRSGNVISINGEPVTVAEACNGLRMIFSLFLVVYVFCFMSPLRPGVRWLLLLTSPVSVVFCNVLRLLPTIVLFGYAPQSVAHGFHDVSGWLMLPMAFFLLIGIVRLMRALGLRVMTTHA